MAILSFLGNTFIACRILDEGEYPGAQLLVMVATFDPPKPEGSTNVKDLNQLKGIFAAKKDGKPGTAFINSTEWGEWGPVEWVPKNWAECEPISMPNDEYMEPEQAHKLMVAAGYNGPFLNMILRKPLYPGVEEPKYMFAMGDNDYILVGAITGKVEEQHATADSDPTGKFEKDA